MPSQAWWCPPKIPATQGAEAGELYIQGQPGQVSETLSQNKNKNCWGCSSVIECLPSTFKAQDSIFSTATKKENGRPA